MQEQDEILSRVAELVMQQADIGAHPLLMHAFSGLDEMIAEILSRSDSPRLTPAELAL